MMEIIAIQMCAAKRSGARSNTMLSRRQRLNQAKRRSTTHLIPLGRKRSSRVPAGRGGSHPGGGLTLQSGCPAGSAFQNMILSK